MNALSGLAGRQRGIFLCKMTGPGLIENHRLTRPAAISREPMLIVQLQESIMPNVYEYQCKSLWPPAGKIQKMSDGAPDDLAARRAKPRMLFKKVSARPRTPAFRRRLVQTDFEKDGKQSKPTLAQATATVHITRVKIASLKREFPSLGDPSGKRKQTKIDFQLQRFQQSSPAQNDKAPEIKQDRTACGSCATLEPLFIWDFTFTLSPLFPLPVIYPCAPSLAANINESLEGQKPSPLMWLFWGWPAPRLGGLIFVGTARSCRRPAAK